MALQVTHKSLREGHRGLHALCILNMMEIAQQRAEVVSVLCAEVRHQCKERQCEGARHPRARGHARAQDRAPGERSSPARWATSWATSWAYLEPVPISVCCYTNLHAHTLFYL